MRLNSFLIAAPREIANFFIAAGLVGRGGGDRNYYFIGNKGALRRSSAF